MVARGHDDRVNAGIINHSAQVSVSGRPRIFCLSSSEVILIRIAQTGNVDPVQVIKHRHVLPGASAAGNETHVHIVGRHTGPSNGRKSNRSAGGCGRGHELTT